MRYSDSGQKPTGFVFVLSGGADGEEWRVYFDGSVQQPTWRERGPALAFLAGLRSGYRKQEAVR